MPVTYTPVTDWVIAAQGTNTGSNKWLGAAARIVSASDSTTTSFHLYGEYSFYQWYRVSGSGTNNVYKYLSGVDSSRFATSTPHEAFSLSDNLTYPCVRGTIRRVELGTYSNNVSVVTPAFDCGWNGSTYSTAAIATYTTPAAPSTNQNVNKVVLGNETLIDISDDTVTEAVLLSGYTAHDRNGASIVGEYVDHDTTYSAGTGLSLSGTTFNHSNSVTAGWIGSSIATTGNVINMPYAQFDGQGHITNKGTITHTSWDRNTPWMLGDGFQGDQKVIPPWPYINVLNDGFWSLILRGATVSLSIDGGTPTTSGMSTLFDGSYDSAITTVPAGSTAVLTIDFTTMSTGYFPEVGTYSYGDIWLSFYYKCGAASVSARGYTDYNSIGWKNLTVTEVYTADTVTAYRGTKWRITNPGLHQIKKLEITYAGKASGTTPAGSSLSTVELNLSRPTTQMLPFITKYSEQKLYYRLTAPQFKGVFEGNSNWYGTSSTSASTSTKVVTCSGFVLAKGATITVNFDKSNTAGGVNLNVNSTGAKTVYANGTAISSNNALLWNAGSVLTFIYDGSHWNVLDTDAGNLLTPGFLAYSPDSVAGTIIPCLYNDLAHLVARGGTVTVYRDGTETTTDTTNCFDGTFNYWAQYSSPTSVVIEITCPQTFTYNNMFYILFNTIGTSAGKVKLETKNSAYTNDVWQTKLDYTGDPKLYNFIKFAHDPDGQGTSKGFNMMRITLGNMSGTLRVAEIGIVNYATGGTRIPFMSRGVDDGVWRSISPATTDTYSLGTSSKKWKNIHATQVNSNSSYYGTSSTTASTAAKTVSCSGFVLVKGATITVAASTANTVAGLITLNVNSTGAKNVYTKNAVTSASNTLLWEAKTHLTFVYDGSYWRFAGSDRVDLPLATSSDVGVVKPDGQSIIVSSDGTLTATPAAVGLSYEETSGGMPMSTYVDNDVGSWPSSGTNYYSYTTSNNQPTYGYGWRQRKWNDGRLEQWLWFYTNYNGTNFWYGAAMPKHFDDNLLAFAETPNWTCNVIGKSSGTTYRYGQAGLQAGLSAGSKYFSFTAHVSAASKYLFEWYFDGHWWIPDSDPTDPTPAEEWAVGDAIAIGGSTYYPVTNWKVSDTGAGGDNRLKAAVRFLITTGSTSGSWHVYAQYAAWTDTGYVNTNNGYFLVRRLNSAITTYTNDAGTKNVGDVWGTLDQNQRQGYVYNGTVSGNLIWGDRPYILTDCGTFGNGQTVTSKTFYVGTTESGYPQVSISDTTTTPSSS